MGAPSTTYNPAKEVGDLINKGRFHKAYDLARKIASLHLVDDLDVHFWFQYILAAQLSGQDEQTILSLRSHLLNSGGYTIGILADLERDTALNLIRTKRLEEARKHLVLSANLTGVEDLNRSAVLRMAYGRLYYAEEEYEEAFGRLDHAYATLNRLGDSANPQYKQNVLFHLFLAETAVGRPFMSRWASYRQILSDKSPVRLARATILMVLGKPGLALDRLIVERR